MGSKTSSDRGRETTDDLFDALGDGYRRTVLSCLREHQRPMTVAELGDAVLERESADGSLDRQQVTASLHHVHVPKLREVGLVRRTGDGLVAYDDSTVDGERLFELLGRGGYADAR